MKIFKRAILLLLLTAQPAFSFKKGEGSQFIMNTEGIGRSDLSIYVAESEFSNINIEYFFEFQSGFISKKMWQQFHMRLVDKGPLSIEAGYVQIPDWKTSEKLTPEYFHVNEGVELQDFLFSDKSKLDKFKVGTEVVEVPAGSITAIHYKKEKNGQTVNFWISDQVKPIGLVKLVSKGKANSHHNYSIELSTLLRNVKAKIIPENSRSLSSKGKAILAKPVKP